MLLKFIVNDGRVLSVWTSQKIRGKTIFDLKVLIGKKFGIPIRDLQIADRRAIYADHFLITKVPIICEELGVPEEHVFHENDLLAFCKMELVCRMRILKTGAHTGGCVESTVMDKTLPKVCSNSVVPGIPRHSSGLVCDRIMDAVCANQSTSTTCNEENSSSETNTSDSPVEMEGCVKRCCPTKTDRPAYFNVTPEDRHFAVFFEGSGEEKINPMCILEIIAKRIKVAEEAKTLRFNACTPVAVVDNALMVVCGNDTTVEWMQRISRPICPPYKFLTIFRYFDLERWCFTVPVPTGKSFCEIFGLLEKQNIPLDTAKWCITNSTGLGTCLVVKADKDVDMGYPKFEVTVYIDQESVDYLSHNCFVLNFLLYHLKFRQCNGACN